MRVLAFLEEHSDVVADRIVPPRCRLSEARLCVGMFHREHTQWTLRGCQLHGLPGQLRRQLLAPPKTLSRCSCPRRLPWRIASSPPSSTPTSVGYTQSVPSKPVSSGVFESSFIRTVITVGIASSAGSWSRSDCFERLNRLRVLLEYLTESLDKPAIRMLFFVREFLDAVLARP